MLILVLIGVYLVFKVTTSCEKLHQDNGRSTERYVILWDVVKLYKILEIEVISSQRDNIRVGNEPCGEKYEKSHLCLHRSGTFCI